MIRLTLLVLMLGLAPAAAETVRVATYDVGLSREGPGLLLHDLGRDPDPDLAAVLAVIREVRPDVLFLNGFDDDLRGRALGAFLALLRKGPDGIDYPYSFRAPVNAGVDSGFDLDGDGLRLGAADALGYGRFPGAGGMALVSRYPIDAAHARTFQTLLWKDVPGAEMPKNPDGTRFPTADAADILRLSSRAHWDAPVTIAGTTIHILGSNPTPPLFDGPEAMNRLRNDAEIAFWAAYLDGTAFRDDAGATATGPDGPLVIAGNLNADPTDGAGLRTGLHRLLSHPRLRDAGPKSAGAAAAAQEGANARQRGTPAQDTADWRDDPGPGNLRVDYLLPSRDLAVTGAGVFWPAPGAPLADVVAAGPPHRMVWIDLRLP